MSETRKAAERLLGRLVGLLLAIAAVVWLLPQIWDKLSPFIVAIPIAAVLQPVIRFLKTKLKLKPSPASLIPVLLLLVIFLGVVIWLFTVGIGQATNIVNNSGNLITESISSVRLAMNNLLASVKAQAGPGVEEWLQKAVNNMIDMLSVWGTNFAAQMVTFSVNLATSMPYVIIYISFLTIGLYFISKDYDELRSYLPGGKRRKQDSRTTQLSNSAVKSLGAYLRVQGTFGLMVWIVSWIYLACFGFEYAGLTALLAGVMELVPMIGSGVPYIVMSILQFLLGKTAQGFQILFLTLGLQIIRRILEPKVMSDSMSISPLESLAGMFIGMRLGGILGLICGPVAMAVLVGAIRSRVFDATIRDYHTVSEYLKERWK